MRILGAALTLIGSAIFILMTLGGMPTGIIQATIIGDRDYLPFIIGGIGLAFIAWDQSRSTKSGAQSEGAPVARSIPIGIVLGNIFLVSMLFFYGHWQAEQTLRKEIEELLNRETKNPERVSITKVVSPFFITLGGKNIVDALIERGAASPIRVEVTVLGSPIFGEYFIEIDGIEMLKLDPLLMTTPPYGGEKGRR
jgi:hypothetical protein